MPVSTGSFSFSRALARTPIVFYISTILLLVNNAVRAARICAENVWVFIDPYRKIGSPGVVPVRAFHVTAVHGTHMRIIFS